MSVIYALFSALFAALTTILAKLGLDGVNSHLATAIRTAVVLVMAWIVVFVTGQQRGMTTLTRNNIIFLCLSGIATGLSWLFYFRAVQIGNVSAVVPIDKLSVVLTVILAFVFLGETVSVKSIIGLVLITGGTLLML